MAGSTKRARRETSPNALELSSDGVTLRLFPVDNPLGRGTFGSIGRFFRVAADREFTSATVVLPYEEADLGYIDAATLRLFRWDEAHRSLVLVEDSGVNPEACYVWGDIPAPGICGIIGLPKHEGLLATIRLFAAIDPAVLRRDRRLVPQICKLILCGESRAARGGLPGNICDVCFGLEVPELGLPETELLDPRPKLTPVPAPWPMYGHDPRHTGRSDYPGPAAQPRVKWLFRAGPIIIPSAPRRMSHPVVGSDGTVYVAVPGFWPPGGPHLVQAVDPQTGAAKWAAGARIIGTFAPLEPKPAIGPDGTIYANDGDETMFAINPSGAGRWWFSSGGVFPSHPLPAADGTIYFHNWRWVSGARQNGLWALRPDRSLRWPSPFDTGVSGDLPLAVRSDGTIIVGGTSVWTLRTDGSVLWTHPLSAGLLAPGSPAIADDGTIYVGVREWPLVNPPYLLALDAQGSPKRPWSSPPWGLITPAIARDGTVYVPFFWLGSKLEARNPDGSPRWSRAIPGGVPDAPAIGRDGTIYLASGSTGSGGVTVYALDPATGTDKWTLNLGPWTWTARSPAIGRDGTLYVVEESRHTLYALA